jgi:hypothetical protein
MKIFMDETWKIFVNQSVKCGRVLKYYGETKLIAQEKIQRQNSETITEKSCLNIYMMKLS